MDGGGCMNRVVIGLSIGMLLLGGCKSRSQVSNPPTAPHAIGSETASVPDNQPQTSGPEDNTLPESLALAEPDIVAQVAPLDGATSNPSASSPATPIAATDPKDRLAGMATGQSSNPFSVVGMFPEGIHLGPLATVAKSVPQSPSVTVLPPIPSAPSFGPAPESLQAPLDPSNSPTVVEPHTPGAAVSPIAIVPSGPNVVPTATIEVASNPTEPAAPTASTVDTAINTTNTTVGTTLPVIPPNPVEPSPSSLAEAVEVRGVVQLGEQWQAIVKEPQERSSRVVRVGDVLAGGQVRVRKIELNANGTPSVVLEQNGIQVIRTIS